MRYAIVTACLIIFGFISTSPVLAQIKINEFSSAGSADWIELYNESDSPVDLSGYLLRDSTERNKKELEGEVPERGFLVVEWHSLDQNGDSVIVIDTVGNKEELVYGTDGIPAPLAGQSVGRMTDGSADWVVFSNPTKGSSNNGSPIFQTPTPTPTVTPTSTKTPTPTKTPKPAKESEVTKIPESVDSPSPQNIPTTKIEATIASQTALLATSDINESTVLDTKDEKKESPDAAVMGASDSLFGGVAVICGIVFLFLSCGILLFKRYKERFFK